MTKRIVLCGSKGSGKSELLQKLSADKYNIYNPTVTKKYQDRLADYRMELQLATKRAERSADLKDTEEISEHSLIDNVAYATTRLSYILNDGIGDEDDQARWLLTLHSCARMLRDGLNLDAVVFVPGHEDHVFYEGLEEAIKAVIWEFIPEYVPKYSLVGETALQRAEEIDTIWKELDEQGNITEESDGEDN